ncbi:S1 family peptidase [Streptomyces sp. AK02-04a]|uniref:S1 family peptidase n=1 Tax=Streptomyces sp. AK02-04a TaxID=3028649 RepID=UPI0029B9DBF1|nr:S1 family peptidase [Streptomyces sp. AK02-04a]MDX3762802.1 S1 family peptidase [Streptomyces sp. AK02-04a]
MSGFRPRTSRTSGLIAATSLAVAALSGTPAAAVSGPQASDAVSTATARLDIGGQRGCSATLVAPQWLLTAASCFTDTPGGPLAPGAPKLKKTTATIGGTAQQVVNLALRTDRDVVMAQLAKPVSGITPVPVAATAPGAGDEVQAAGYGRTHDEWVPDQVHAAAFTTQNVGATTVDLAGKSDGAVICKGDTGGPVLITAAGHTAVVGVSSRSWQGGCLGTDASETRTGAVAARVDDLAGWVQQVAYSTIFADAPWEHAVQMTAGYYTGGSAGGSRHMDLIVLWDDGEVTLYQGGDSNDAAHPFSAEHQLAPRKSIWTHAVSITGVNATGGGTDGLVVRWNDGEMTQYTTVDAKGFHGEKQLAPRKTPAWQNDARLLTGGRFSPGGHRDDLLVEWKDGHVSLFSDLAANGLSKQTQIVAKNTTTWPYAENLTTGSFTGKSTDDLLVRWVDGETTLYPGLTGKALPGEDRIRPAKSEWKDAAVITAGAFTANTAANDVIVRWSDGHVSLFTGVDAKGLHDEVRLAPAN